MAELFVCLLSWLEVGSGKREHEALATFRTRNGAGRFYLVLRHDLALHTVILVQGLDITECDSLHRASDAARSGQVGGTSHQSNAWLGVGSSETR